MPARVRAVPIPVRDVIAFLAENSGSRRRIGAAIQNALAGRTLSDYELKVLLGTHVEALASQLAESGHRELLEARIPGHATPCWAAHMVLRTGGSMTIWQIGPEPQPALSPPNPWAFLDQTQLGLASSD